MIMRKLSSIALVALAIVLATTSFSHAAAQGGHGFSGQPESGHSGHFESHPRFDGHRDFQDRRDFDRRFHGRGFIGVPFGWAPAYPNYDPPAYTYAPPAPTYWYYCPSYEAYYPTVPSCPEEWVPVPAQ